MPDLWSALSQHHNQIETRRIQSLFEDKGRFDDFSVAVDGLLLDYSKTNIDEKTRSMLVLLAEQADVPQKRDAMFAGERINRTEDRAVLHTALRDMGERSVFVDGTDIMPEVHETRKRMEAFSAGIRSGEITTNDNRLFTDIVNIGIGGSDLGPAMATLALAPYHDGPNCHFVSNVDGAHIADVLKGLDPATTLVIIASKTFTTIETMTNAETAIRWLKQALGEDIQQHLASVSTALDKTAALGIKEDRVFGFGDWVGGRHSLWGPVGLSLMLAIGGDRFREFLEGAHAMDQHFQSAPLAQNLPVLLALIGIWHRNICGYPSRAVLPYDQRLARLPAYLQQLDMESNGKRVAMDGSPLTRQSGPVVWGEPGTNGQHAFYQLLHQGTDIVPVEFLIAAHGHESDLADQHDLLKANCLAQSEALMIGRTAEEARIIAKKQGFTGQDLEQQALHRTFPGNRPSITLAYGKLTPFVLGQLIALYEHRVFVEGAIWGLNSFDQWGVELGKELAQKLLPTVRSGKSEHDEGSTAGLINWLSTLSGK